MSAQRIGGFVGAFGPDKPRMSAGRALYRSAAFANGGVVREVLGLAFRAREDHGLDIRAIFRNSRYALKPIAEG